MHASAKKAETRQAKPDRKWFRRTTWTPEDEREFHNRLSRARSVYSKAQYLRIQAYHLQHDAEPPLYEAAQALLERLIADYPDPAELGAAYLQLGKCHEALGHIQEASQALEKAVRHSVMPSGVRNTDAVAHFAMLVAEHAMRDRYAQVFALLSPQDMTLVIPEVRFKVHAALALIGSDTGQRGRAGSHAGKALALVAESDPAVVDESLCNRLETILNQKPRPWWRFWRRPGS